MQGAIWECHADSLALFLSSFTTSSQRDYLPIKDDVSPKEIINNISTLSSSKDLMSKAKINKPVDKVTTEMRQLKG